MVLPGHLDMEYLWRVNSNLEVALGVNLGEVEPGVEVLWWLVKWKP